MTKFAATSINDKTPSKSVSPEPLDRFEEIYIFIRFVCRLGTSTYHWWPGRTMTYLTSMSNFVSYAFL